MDDVKMSEMTHQCNPYLTFICLLYHLPFMWFSITRSKTDLGRHNCHLIYFGTEWKIKKICTNTSINKFLDIKQLEFDEKRTNA